MIPVYIGNKNSKNFSVEVDEYAGVISITSTERCFVEPMTFRYVKDCMLSVETDYLDNRIQEIIVSYYRKKFNGFNLDSAQTKKSAVSVKIPDKKKIEKHMLFWNQDIEEDYEIYLGKDFLDVKLTNIIDVIYIL